MAMTNAERQAKWRNKQKELIAYYKAENLRLKRKINKLLKRLRSAER